jgi:hypothetical protein
MIWVAFVLGLVTVWGGVFWVLAEVRALHKESDTALCEVMRHIETLCFRVKQVEKLQNYPVEDWRLRRYEKGGC